jgi:hypothetical protein
MHKSALTEPRSSQFSIIAVLKLLTVMAMVFSIVPVSFGYYWTIVMAGAATGIFLAEHFAKSKSREVLFLLFFPLLFAGLATILPLLTARERPSLEDLVFWFVMGTLVGIVPVALSVVALSISSAVVHRFTGIRLLKFEWDLGNESNHAGEQSDEREPE